MLPLGSSVLIQSTRYFTQELLLASPGFTVVRADNLLLNRSEALKVSHTPSQQILQDAARIGRLCHPANVRVLHAGSVDLGEQRSVVAMPFPGGRTFESMLEEDGPLSPLRACRLLGQVLSALSEAHEAELIYGSLSPFTVRCCDRVTEQVCIADYGLSSPVHSNHQNSPTHLLNSAPSYTAPERFLGSAPSPQGDLFSVAVMFYELLTGHKPFPHDGFGLLQAYQRGVVPTPMSEHAEVPPKLAQLIHQMMDVDVDRRIPSAEVAAGRLLQLDPDELQAYSTSPMLERNALSGDLNLPKRAPTAAPRMELLEQPEVWALVDDPAFRLPETEQLLAELEDRYMVLRLDAAAAAAVLAQLQAGARALPWVVLFGDLHVILGEPLVAALGQRGELSRVLVSTHLNVEMMHSTVNLCSLDQQLLARAPLGERLAAVDAMVERTRGILSAQSAAHIQLREAQSTIFDLKLRLAASQQITPSSRSRRV